MFAITHRTALGVIVAVTAAGLLSAGCQNGVTGPSLSSNFSQVTFVPTVAGLQGGENVCCCHLSGRFTNTSSIAVDAELRFPAKDKSGVLVGQGEDLLTNVPSGASRSFLAVGITAPCASLTMSQILADGTIRLKGMFVPPND
jgi:hypothetical protein